MSRVYLRLFGHPRVEFMGIPTPHLPSRCTTKLFVFLILGRKQLYSREALIDSIWPECKPEHGKHRLRTALWRLRKVLEPQGVLPGTYLCIRTSGDVGFNAASDYWLDLAEFETAASLACRFDFDAIDSVIGGMGLYREDFLADLYDAWAIRERERIRCLYLRSLNNLTDYFSAQGAFQRAVEFAEKVLELDPLREDVHRKLIRLHVIIGDRAQAIRQYRICRELLSKELGITPMPETEALYRLLCEPSAVAIGNERDRHPLGEIAAALVDVKRRLDDALRLLDKVGR